MVPSLVSQLRRRAGTLTTRAVVPFSDEPRAAVLLLDDGTWIPGVRVESASYSLVLPALLNAYTTAVSLNRATNVRGIVVSHPFRPEEELYLEQLGHTSFDVRGDDVWLCGSFGDDEPSILDDPLLPFIRGSVTAPREGVDLARQTARRAHVPDSNFHVGALLQCSNGRLVPGVNVEHPDWTRTLCAERNTLGAFFSYGLKSAERLFLSCTDDPEGSPCGACRQLLAERLPDTEIWLDRQDADPERTTPSTLLPSSFQGQTLLNRDA